MKKKEINKLLKDKKFKKLAEEFKKKIKRHAKDINKQEKQFYKTLEEIVKIRKKFEKQLAKLKRWLHFVESNLELEFHRPNFPLPRALSSLMILI